LYGYFFFRKDTCTLYLPEFVDWAQKTLSAEPSVFLTVGILTTLCWIFKLGQREVLLPIAEEMEDMLASIESKEQFMSNSTAKQSLSCLSVLASVC